MDGGLGRGANWVEGSYSHDIRRTAVMVTMTRKCNKDELCVMNDLLNLCQCLSAPEHPVETVEPLKLEFINRHKYHITRSTPYLTFIPLKLQNSLNLAICILYLLQRPNSVSFSSKPHQANFAPSKFFLSHYDRVQLTKPGRSIWTFPP